MAIGYLVNKDGSAESLDVLSVQNGTGTGKIHKIVVKASGTESKNGEPVELTIILVDAHVASNPALAIEKVTKPIQTKHKKKTSHRRLQQTKKPLEIRVL